MAACGGALALLLAGCGSQTNTLEPKSPQAKSVASLGWWLIGSCSFGLAFVTALLVLAWFRRRSMGEGREPGERAGWIVVLALGMAVMVVGMCVVFVVGDVFVIRDTQAPAAASTDMTIRAVGHQWYWEFDYPRARVTTAGELHIPVRTPVLADVTTADVIHSFWVPELNRKIDAIPGQRNAIELYADTPGTYHGECLQYCGLQHAHMDFIVVAQPLAAFQAWLAHERKPAAQPSGGVARRGERVFLNGSCSSCHTIDGTSAHGYIGPNLTHVGSRSTLGSGVIPNTPQELAAWITSNQSIKPGNQMPDVPLPRSQLRALVTYLESLK